MPPTECLGPPRSEPTHARPLRSLPCCVQFLVLVLKARPTQYEYLALMQKITKRFIWPWDSLLEGKTAQRPALPTGHSLGKFTLSTYCMVGAGSAVVGKASSLSKPSGEWRGQVFRR